MFLCFLDEFGRTLTDKSLSQLTAEFMKREGVKKLTNYSGAGLNSPKTLKEFIDKVGLDVCVVVFLSSTHQPYRLSSEQLSKVYDMLDSNVNSSGEAIRLFLTRDCVLT